MKQKLLIITHSVNLWVNMHSGSAGIAQVPLLVEKFYTVLTRWISSLMEGPRNESGGTVRVFDDL